MFACCCGATESPQSRYVSVTETRYGWPPHIEAYNRSLIGTLFRSCTYREDWDFSGCVGGFIVQITCDPTTGIRTVISETLNNWNANNSTPTCLPGLVSRRVTGVSASTKTWNITAFAQQTPVYGTGSLVYADPMALPTFNDIIAALAPVPFGPWGNLIPSGQLAARAGYGAETFTNQPVVNRGEITNIPPVRRWNITAQKSEHRNVQRYCLKRLDDHFTSTFFTCETPLVIAGSSVVIMPVAPTLRVNSACQPEPQIGQVSCSLVAETTLWWEPAWGGTNGCCHA